MNGEVVVVTGASAGVGRATAVAFGRQGACVALLARGLAGLEAAARDVERVGGTALVVQVDVADAAAVRTAADRVEREFGPIDVWVNNAMATVFAPIAETDPEEFRRATETTYLGFVWGTMAVLPGMLARDAGVIVQVGSALSYRAIPLQAAYCGAKFAIRGFTDSLRSELLHAGSRVRVTMVQMPALNTPQFSWGRTNLPRHPQPVEPIYQPEVAADAIYWAAHHDRRELWVGGRNVLTMIGAKFLSGALDHMLARTAFAGQQTADPVDPDRASNLFRPVDQERDFGSHGIFDARSRARSVQLALAKRRPLSGAFSRPLAGILERLFG